MSTNLDERRMRRILSEAKAAKELRSTKGGLLGYKKIVKHVTSA